MRTEARYLIGVKNAIREWWIHGTRYKCDCIRLGRICRWWWLRKVRKTN